MLTVTPITARAQILAPLPFVGVTEVYAVRGCGGGVLGGPPFTNGTALCALGTATVGTVVSPYSSDLYYQALFDLALERQPGFAQVFRFEQGFVSYTWVESRNGAAFETSEDFSSGRFTLTQTRFTAWPTLLPPVGNVVPGSLQFSGAVLEVFYRDPRNPYDLPALTLLPLSMSIVPEPSTLALAVAGGLVLAAVTMRKRRTA